MWIFLFLINLTVTSTSYPCRRGSEGSLERESGTNLSKCQWIAQSLWCGKIDLDHHIYSYLQFSSLALRILTYPFFKFWMAVIYTTESESRGFLESHSHTRFVITSVSKFSATSLTEIISIVKGTWEWSWNYPLLYLYRKQTLSVPASWDIYR